MKKFLTTFLLMAVLVSLAPAQSLLSPYETLYTQLSNLQKDNYNPGIAAAVIPPSITDESKREELAIEIKLILDGKGLYVHLEALPKGENFIDTSQGKHIFIVDPLEPRIYLEKVGDNWYYSMSTIEKVDKMYEEVFPFGTKVFSKLLPSSTSNKQFFGLLSWQWLGMVLVSLACILFFVITHKLVKLILHYAIFKKELISKENEGQLKKIAKSFGLVSMFFLLSKIIPSLQFPPQILQYMVKTITILLTFLVAILVIRIFTLILFYFKPHVENTSSKLDDQLLPIVGKLFKILVVIVAISVALKQLNVNLTAIIAGLSIGGLALALASQDTVKNFIGTVTILLDHPFEVGDFIQLDGAEGTVEEVGMRATRLRTPNQSVAYIPNGELSNKIIDNLGLRVYRRWKWVMSVEYGTKPEQLADFCARVKLLINEHNFVAQEKTTVSLNELGGSSINILINVFLAVQSYDAELDSKHVLLLKLIALADEMNISFAFPTQTLHLKQ
jgi:MscS family membrane protein